MWMPRTQLTTGVPLRLSRRMSIRELSRSTLKDGQTDTMSLLKRIPTRWHLLGRKRAATQDRKETRSETSSWTQLSRLFWRRKFSTSLTASSLVLLRLTSAHSSSEVSSISISTLWSHYIRKSVLSICPASLSSSASLSSWFSAGWKWFHTTRMPSESASSIPCSTVWTYLAPFLSAATSLSNYSAKSGVSAQEPKCLSRPTRTSTYTKAATPTQRLPIKMALQLLSRIFSGN